MKAAVEDLRRNPEHYASIGITCEADLVARFIQDAEDSKVRPGRRTGLWMNDRYTVQVYDDGGDWFHLSIKRNDREPLRDWRDLQWIKNQLVGEEHDGIELFPAESRKVDSANQYHLFVLKDPRARIPVGFSKRWVTDNEVGQARQRPGSQRSES